MKIKVLKFGGTSLASFPEFQKVFEIVKTQLNGDKLIVVLSASSGITQKLIYLTNILQNNPIDRHKILNEIEGHHIRIASKLIEEPKLLTETIRIVENFIQSINLLLEGALILEELTPKVKDQILAYGELLSSYIFYNFALSKKLNCTILDAREIIITDGIHLNAAPELQLIESNSTKIQKLFENFDLIITQGFIGSWRKDTTTLGRGGSDLSASLFAYAVVAAEIQIWTDVNGILSADPRIVKNPRTIPVMSFDEVSELAFWGAKVLHPESIKPAMLKKIPVKILNTFEPSNEGTIIVDNLEDIISGQELISPKIHSLTLLENCYIIKKKLTPLTRPFQHYYQVLNQPYFKILHLNGNQNNFIAIIKILQDEESFLSLLKDETISFRPVDIISLCGINLHKPNHTIYNKLIKIIQELKSYPLQQIVYRSSDYSIFFAIEKGNGREVIEILHKIITE